MRRRLFSRTVRPLGTVRFDGFVRIDNVDSSCRMCWWAGLRVGIPLKGLVDECPRAVLYLEVCCREEKRVDCMRTRDSR